MHQSRANEINGTIPLDGHILLRDHLDRISYATMPPRNAAVFGSSAEGTVLNTRRTADLQRVCVRWK